MPDDIEVLPASPNELTSRTYIYLAQLYQSMKAESADGVYEGKVVETFQGLNISMAYYTQLFNALKELGCIELIDRGVRGRPTKYRLHGEPTEDAYTGRYGAEGLTVGVKPATIPLSELEQRVKNMERRLQGLDIKEIFLDHEQRIVKLEKEGGSK